MREELRDLRQSVTRLEEQLSLLVQEKDHVYASNVFEIDDEETVGTAVTENEADLDALHARKRVELDRERVVGAPKYVWDEHYKGEEIKLSDDELTARGYKKVQVILAQQPM